MNIALIYPLLSMARSRIDENKQYWPPLGLAYVAAALERGGHCVQIIDRDVLLRKNRMDFDATDRLTDEAVEAAGAGIVGIGGTTPTISDTLHVAQRIKRRNPGRMVVAGGPHVTAEPEAFLKECECIDAIVRGEGEMTMLDLAGGMPFKEILGIAFKKGPEVVVNPDRPLCADLDALPFPARHLLDMTFYTRPSRFISRNLSLRSTSIFTARGCPYRCNFCAGPLLFNQKVRFHSPERVIEEIGQLINQYGAEGIYFAEDMFLSDKGRAKKFMGLFKQYGYDKKIRWFAQLRANIVDAELLYMMKDCGCAQVEYGFESGSQRILDLMNKKASIEQNIRAARLTRNAGIRFQGNIIVGYPGEQEEDFKKTIKFLWKSRPHSIGFNLFMPLPGTPSYQRLKLDNRPLPAWDTIGDAEVVDFNYADMPPGRFAKLYMKARLTTVLPINLFYFLKYNSRDPIRLCRMITTQFRGVIIKLVRGIFKLAK